MVMRIKARRAPPAADWTRYDGEEFVYVLAGTLEFHAEAHSPVILEKGDSCYLDAGMRHAFVSKGKEEAVVLSVHISLLLPDGLARTTDGLGK
jgi:quercetin dioxygenase-like cupin family protein